MNNMIDLKEYRESLATDAEWAHTKLDEATAPNVRAYWMEVMKKWIIVDHALETVIEAAAWVDALKECRAIESDDKRGDTPPSSTK